MPIAVKPTTAIITVLLVLCLVLWSMRRSAVAERDQARAELPRVLESLHQLEAATKDVNAAIETLAAQGREISSQVAQASSQAEGLQRAAELKAERIISSQRVVPQDPAGALAWAHTVTAAAAREFSPEASR